MEYNEFIKMNELENSHWWYKSRTNLLKHDLKACAKGEKKLRILDLGCGCGGNFSVCKNLGEYYGIDISKHSMRYCKSKNITNLVQADAHFLPLKPESFDIVIALDCFEHFKDDVASMREIYRGLKSDGVLIFNVPALMTLFSNHDRAFHHLRRYTIGELNQKLSMLGFKIRFISYWSFFVFPAVYLFRKVFNNKKDEKNSVSDFYMKVPVAVEKAVNCLNKIENSLINKKVMLPLGVCIYGSALKES